MKKVTVILIGFLLVVNTMFAQFTNTNNSKTFGSADVNGWSGIRVAYSPMKLEVSGMDIDFTGLSAGFVKGFEISSQTPVFAEIGVNFQWLSSNLKSLFASLDVDIPSDAKAKFNVYSIGIPVNLGYRYQASEELSVFPYVGVNARGNIAGTISASYQGQKESINIFDDGDTEGDPAKRFQIGWQIGLGVNFSQLYLSASYGSDFSEFMTDGKFSSIPSFTLGLNF